MTNRLKERESKKNKNRERKEGGLNMGLETGGDATGGEESSHEVSLVS